MKKIFILGSINTDLVMTADRMPMTGESLKGSRFIINQGGKGANQAVACKKLGGERVAFIGAVGNDSFGKDLLRSLSSYGVEVSAVSVKDCNSGVCMILLDKSKNDNVLVVELGANERVEYEDFLDYLDSYGEEGDLFITQLEITLDATRQGLKKAKERGMYTILKPSPAVKIGEEFLKYTDLIVLNETECELIAEISVDGEDAAKRVYSFFADHGVRETLITLGAKGCYYLNGDCVYCPAQKVEAVDTTSAGDTFIGALAVRKASGYSIASSLEFAARCSAITVSRIGASSSIPTLDEVLHR